MRSRSDTRSKIDKARPMPEHYVKTLEMPFDQMPCEHTRSVRMKANNQPTLQSVKSPKIFDGIADANNNQQSTDGDDFLSTIDGRSSATGPDPRAIYLYTTWRRPKGGSHQDSFTLDGLVRPFASPGPRLCHQGPVTARLGTQHRPPVRCDVGPCFDSCSRVRFL